MVALLYFRVDLIERAERMAYEVAQAGSYEEWAEKLEQIEECGSFFEMLIDLRKWTFRQFYPCFAGKL